MQNYTDWANIISLIGGVIAILSFLRVAFRQTFNKYKILKAQRNRKVRLKRVQILRIYLRWLKQAELRSTFLTVLALSQILTVLVFAMWMIFVTGVFTGPIFDSALLIWIKLMFLCGGFWFAVRHVEFILDFLEGLKNTASFKDKITKELNMLRQIKDKNRKR